MDQFNGNYKQLADAARWKKKSFASSKEKECEELTFELLNVMN